MTDDDHRSAGAAEKPMDATMIELLYCSRSRIGDGEAADAAIRDILATARGVNARMGVTGALLFSRGCFAQVLEGAGDAVQAVFSQIRADARHDKIVVLSQSPIRQRGLAGNPMAFSSGGEAVEHLAALTFRRAFDCSNRTVATDMLQLIQRSLAVVQIW